MRTTQTPPIRGERGLVKVMPSLQYTLAPRKVSKKEGAESLRAAVLSSQEVSTPRSHSHFDGQSMSVHVWFTEQSLSRVRVLMDWQSAGGPFHVASVFHRSATVLKEYGKTEYEL